MIFTPLVFYFIYGEKVKIWEILGYALIIFSIVLIVLGTTVFSDSNTKENLEYYDEEN